MRIWRVSCQLFTVAIVLMVLGCSNPAELSGLNEEKIKSVDDQDLCEAYYHGGADNVRNEINRRELITERRWNQVDSNKVATGMTECAVYAALGSPNRTIAKTSNDPAKIFIYRKNDTLVNVYYDDKRVQKIERKEP